MSFSILNKCPICHASKPTLPNCHRCRSDLTNLWRIAETASNLILQGNQQFLNGAYLQALESGMKSWRLFHSEDSLKLIALSSLMLYRFEEALETYRKHNELAFPMYS